LGIGEERVAGELVGIPQREIPIFYAFHPEESGGDKIGGKVPFGKEPSAGEDIIKKEDRGKEKGQTSQKIG